jgi:CubicO group peptidase (beta-lactamase class C family)
MTSGDYQGEFNNYYYQGYRLKLINGYTVGGKDRYTAIWHSAGISPDAINVMDTKIQAYMKQHSLPGMSIAIVKDGRLVFAKGYGNTDIGTGERMNPADRFRIASVSKPVTSIAIMKLIEQNKFSLDSKVFGSGGLLGTKYGTEPYSERVKKITVRHLLSHISGWSNESNDPMFSNPSYNHSQLIGWVLDNRAVKNDPGSTYEYFNFGYCLLGRIIEKVTGQSYDAHVKSAILAPSGITRMEIGGDTLAQRKPDEVVYYQPGGNPYGMKVARMDAHGGWIATPIDLLRLMVRADGFPTKPDLLQPGSITAMWTGSSANMGYGLGWGLGSDNRSHNGAFSGGIANLVRLNNGFEFAFVVNTRPATDDFSGKGQAVLTDIVSAVTAWPAYDLF